MKNYINYFNKVLKNDSLSHLYLLYGENIEDLKIASNKIIYNILTFNKSENSKLKEKIENNTCENIYLINGANGIKKEDIHALQVEFSKTSNFNDLRFYVISDFENINLPAANSMLKFLEEPVSKKTVGFLLTKNKDLILPTIISRVQPIYISENEIGEYLKDLEDIACDDFLKEISTVFTRNKEVAKKLFQNEMFIQKCNLLKDFFKSFYILEINLVLKFYKVFLENIKSNLDMKEVSETIFIFLLDLLKDEKKNMVFKSLYQEIKECKKIFKKDSIKEMIKLTEEFSKIQNFQNNIELQFYSYLLKLQKERENAWFSLSIIW